MGAPNDYFVDPSLGSDTGDGTVGTPWGRASGSVIQYALDTITRDSTHGDRIHVKAGVSDVISATFGFGTFGAPTVAANLTIRGYTAVADDGGQGSIDCNGISSRVINSTGYVNLIDMELFNSTSDYIAALNSCCLHNCEIHDCSTAGVYLSYTRMTGCNLYDIDTTGITPVNSTYVLGNYLSNEGTKEMSTGIFTGQGCSVSHNIINVDGATDGINIGNGNRTLAQCNTIFSNGGTGHGIHKSGNGNSGCMWNLVEGFSGTSGEGIGISAATSSAVPFLGNAVFDCETDINPATHYMIDEDNEVLIATPFAKEGAATFANRAAYWAPISNGNVLTGGPHGQHKGAVAPAGGGGGGGYSFAWE